MKKNGNPPLDGRFYREAEQLARIISRERESGEEQRRGEGAGAEAKEKSSSIINWLRISFAPFFFSLVPRPRRSPPVLLAVHPAFPSPRFLFLIPRRILQTAVSADGGAA